MPEFTPEQQALLDTLPEAEKGKRIAELALLSPEQRAQYFTDWETANELKQPFSNPVAQYKEDAQAKRDPVAEFLQQYEGTSFSQDADLRTRVAKRLRADTANLSEEGKDEYLDGIKASGAFLFNTIVGQEMTALEDDRSGERRRDFDKAFGNAFITPIVAQLSQLDLPPSLKVDLSKYRNVLLEQQDAIAQVFEQWFQRFGAGQPIPYHLQASRFSPSRFLSDAWKDMKPQMRLAVPFMGDANAADLEQGITQSVFDLVERDLLRQKNQQTLEDAIDDYAQALDRAADLNDALDEQAKRDLKQAAQDIRNMKDSIRTDYKDVADAVAPQVFLSAILPQKLGIAFAGTPLARGVVAGDMTATVNGLIDQAVQGQQTRQEAAGAERDRQAVAQQQAAREAIQRAHQANPDFDLPTALANLDAAIRTGQTVDAQAIVDQARADQAAQPAQVTAKNTGEVIELWRQSQDFDLMAALRQIGDDPKANVAAIVTRARADWRRGLGETQEQAFGQFAGQTQTFEGDASGTVSFRPADIFSEQQLQNVRNLFAVSAPGQTALKEPVSAAKLREAFVGPVNVEGAEAFSAAEIGQLSGQSSRFSQLISSVAQMKGLDLSKPFADTRSLADFNAALSLSLRQAQEADTIAAQRDAAIGAQTQAQFNQTGAEAERKRQEALKPKPTIQVRTIR